MTTTQPPSTPGSRRAIPVQPTRQQAERMEALLRQDRDWVLRGDWESYLRTGAPWTLRPVDGLTRDQRIAALEWLRQQRHRLHQVVEGQERAPAGWLEDLPLYRALQV